MPQRPLDGWGQPVVAAAKAAVMYGIALVGLRVAHRRPLSQWTAIDFAAAVAMGAIVGRTAIAEGQSVAVGAAALVTILAAHYRVAVGRFHPLVARLVDQRVRVLVDHGHLRPDQLRRCGLTEAEVLAQLRLHGVASVGELRYVLDETKGELTIVGERGAGAADPELVRTGLRITWRYGSGRGVDRMGERSGAGWGPAFAQCVHPAKVVRHAEQGTDRAGHGRSDRRGLTFGVPSTGVVVGWPGRAPSAVAHARLL